jgi:predicted permease
MRDQRLSVRQIISSYDPNHSRHLDNLTMRILRDLGFAARIGRRSPGLTLAVVCTLAIGIGATIAMFAVVNDVLFRPLPYLEPDRLVSLQASVAQPSAFSVPDFLDFQASASAYSSMAIWNRSSAVLSGPPEAEEAAALDVSWQFFGTVGVRPLLGRGFLSGDEVGSVVVVSEGLWDARYGRDPGIVGRTILVDSKPVTVVGVVPALLDQYVDAQLFRLLDLHSGHATVRGYHTQPVIGRLRPGVTLAIAAAEAKTIGSRLASTYAEDRAQSFTVRSYQEFLASRSRIQLLALLGAVVLVLLVACGNVGSLMLTRMATRRGELATRVAVGASIRDLLQQLMIECLFLSVSGGVMAVAIAALVIRLVRIPASNILPRAAEIHLDGLALIVAFCVSIGAGVAIGVIAAVEASRPDLSRRLTTAGRASGSKLTASVRDWVVVAQFVMSTVLLVAAFALINSFRALRQVDPGFDPKGVFAAYVTLPDKQYPAQAQHLFWSEILAQVRGLPNVNAASAVSRLPFGGGANGMASYLVPGTSIGSANPAFAEYDIVEDHYFETMRIPVIAGTSLDTPEASGQEPVVVISASLAATTFRFGSPIGRTMTFPDFGGFGARVIGVVGNVRTRGLTNGLPDVVYFPASQMFGFEGHAAVVARVTGDPFAISSAVRRIVAGSNPLLAVDHPRLMLDVVGQSAARLKFESTVLGSFAVTATFLAGIGLLGLLGYGVTIRSREFAIRFALGAQAHQLFSMVLRRGVALIATGGAIAGLLVPVVMSLVQNAFGIREKSLGPILVTSVTLAMIGCVACIAPALQAVRLGSSWSDRP